MLISTRRSGAWRVAPWLAGVVAVAACARLGVWQLDRAEQKLSLQAQWESVIEQAPVTLSTDTLAHVATRLPGRVAARGVWLNSASVWLDNRPLDGRAGFWLVTPLRIEGNRHVLVLRGWTPRDPLDRLRVPALEENSQTSVELTGVAVAGLSNLLSLGTVQQPRTLPAVWQTLDVANYRFVTGLEVEPFVIHLTNVDSIRDADATREPVTPVPMRAAWRVERHHGYAVQWFSLSALVVGLMVFFGWRAWRRK